MVMLTGAVKSATAIVGPDGISNITDIPFPHGGEISPDGRRIAFDTCDRSNRAIAIATLDNSESRIIEPVFGESCATVRWAPDAARLSYAGAYDYLLHVVDLVTVPTRPFHTHSSRRAGTPGRRAATRLSTKPAEAVRAESISSISPRGGRDSWSGHSNLGVARFGRPIGRLPATALRSPPATGSSTSSTPTAVS